MESSQQPCEDVEVSATQVRDGNLQRTGTQRLIVLRRWLLTAVALLSVILAGFISYEKHRARGLLADIPRRLGLNIRSETNGFVYTQSVKGRVLFTIHAAKAIQRENGKTTLHNVAIEFHGASGSNHTDTIRGDEFEYDQASGIVQALGEVYLDLAAPLSGTTGAKPSNTRILVRTRGLVFLQKLGVAATNEPLTIVYGEMHGSAHGADYETDGGTLILRSDVRLDGEHGGELLHVVASHAELERTALKVTLQSAKVQADTKEIIGDHLVALLTKEGTIQSLEAEGHVAVAGTDGQHLQADHLHAMMSATGQPQQVFAQGRVQLADAQYTASSGSALFHFSSEGNPLTTELTDAVQVNVSGYGTQAKRTISASHAVLDFVTANQRTELREMTADGGASMRSVETRAARPVIGAEKGSQGLVVTKMFVSAQMLHASTDSANGKRYVSAIDGKGQTSIEQDDNLGTRTVTTADTLQAKLVSLPATVTGAEEQSVLQTLIQTGNVRLERHTTANQAAPGGSSMVHAEDDQATAQTAEWDNATEELRLSGNPVLSTPGIQLAADNIVLLQRTSTAEASGNVRGSFQQIGKANAEPVHVTADHGRIDSRTGHSTFEGGLRPVHLWTGTASLEALHMDLEKASGTLVARSLPAHTPTDVKLTLFHQDFRSQAKQQRGPLVVKGREITMVSASGQIPAHIAAAGHASLTSDGTDIHAEQMTAVLNQTATHSGGSSERQPSVPDVIHNDEGIRSILATGDVHIQQPGRSASGESLLYVAKDDLYRLSGTHDRPSLLHDSLHGDVTGSVLLFHSDDERAEITGELPKQVHTVLPAPVTRQR